LTFWGEKGVPLKAWVTRRTPAACVTFGSFFGVCHAQRLIWECYSRVMSLRCPTPGEPQPTSHSLKSRPALHTVPGPLGLRWSRCK
jgi:hypothetical protein